MTKKKPMEPRIFMFDTHQHVKDLQSAGFNEKQAEVIVKSLLESREVDMSHLATKDQVSALDNKINDIDKKIDISVAKLETRISETQNSTLRWMLASMFTFTSIIIGVIIAAIKYVK